MFADWARKLFRQPPPPAPAASTVEAPLLLPGSGGRPFPALVDIIRACARDADGDGVLLFGDSVMERTSRGDTDQRTLGTMIAEALQERPVATISYSAFNPQIFAALARVAVRLPRPPSVVILPVNLRCFSPQWDLNPAWQFEAELALIERYLSAPDTVILPIADIREAPGFYASFDATPVSFPLSRLSTIGEFRALVRQPSTDEAGRRARAAEIFVYHYTHPLTAEHRKVRALREAVTTFIGAGCRVLCYLTPINHEAGERLLGSAFKPALRANAAVVASALRELPDVLQDLSEALPDEHFFHEDLATEHLNERGRSVLARLVSELAPARA